MTTHAARRCPPVRSRAGATIGLLVALLAATMTSAPDAAAHGADDGVRYRLVEVAPAVDGLTVEVVRGPAGQLVLANDSGEQVEVLDDAGRPFLRIGPDGVSGDVASATWRASDRPFGPGGTTSTDPDGGGHARWVPLSGASSWGWYDHRMHVTDVVAPPEATGPVVLESWTVPLRVGGTEVTVRGETLAGPRRGHVAPRLASGPEVAEGARVQLLPGTTPGLLLHVEEGHHALVRGEAGEPFLRFADGEVVANAASPTWHRIGGGQAVPTAVDGRADPAWQPVAAGQRYGWVEPPGLRAVAPGAGHGQRHRAVDLGGPGRGGRPAHVDRGRADLGRPVDRCRTGGRWWPAVGERPAGGRGPARGRRAGLGASPP